MKPSSKEADLKQLREQLRQQIDNAAKSVADLLHATTDLLFATLCHRSDTVTNAGKVTTGSVPEMMSPQQAADYLGVTVGTLSIWRCRRSYPLPFVKVGRKVCYRKSDLDTFIERRTRGSDDHS